VVLAGQAAFGCSGQHVDPILVIVFLFLSGNVSVLVAFETTIRR
jgi:hypothetical protein